MLTCQYLHWVARGSFEQYCFMFVVFGSIVQYSPCKRTPWSGQWRSLFIDKAAPCPCSWQESAPPTVAAGACTALSASCSVLAAPAAARRRRRRLIRLLLRTCSTGRRSLPLPPPPRRRPYLPPAPLRQRLSPPPRQRAQQPLQLGHTRWASRPSDSESYSLHLLPHRPQQSCYVLLASLPTTSTLAAGLAHPDASARHTAS
jgi:hypothetical protein